jgi:hypothetical protein
VKNSLFLLALIAFPLWSASAEGGSGSHGGGFVFCQSAAAPQRVELGDVYEGRVMRGYSYRILEAEPMKDISMDVLPRLLKAMPSAMKTRFKDEEWWIKSQYGNRIGRDPQLDQDMQNSPDIDEEYLRSVRLPPGCKFHQGAKYYDYPRRYDYTYVPFQALREEGADLPDGLFGNLVWGLMFHEVIYKIARDQAMDSTSARARKIVALAYSDPFLDENDLNHEAVVKQVKKLCKDLWNHKPFQDLP